MAQTRAMTTAAVRARGVPRAMMLPSVKTCLDVCRILQDTCAHNERQRVAGNPYRSRLSKPGPASREPVFCPPPDDKIGNRRWQFGPRPREERHVGSQHVSQAV